MNLSDNCGAIKSGLFVFCDCSHFCSRPATAFSDPSCDHATLPSKNTPTTHHIQALFIGISLVCWSFCEEECSPAGHECQCKGTRDGKHRKMRGAAAAIPH